MAQKRDWDHALQDAIKVRWTDISWFPHERSTFPPLYSPSASSLRWEAIFPRPSPFAEKATSRTREQHLTSRPRLRTKIQRLCFSWSRQHKIFFHVIRISTPGFQVIAIFNADQHEEAIIFVQELAGACPKHDFLACCVVEVSIRSLIGLSLVHW
jgi:hypothetical protein